MPYVYEINAGKRTVTVEFAGKLAASEISAYAEDLRSNPQFDPGFSEVIDLRQVVEVELDANQALSLADQADPFALKSQRAFIARTPSQENAARMHHLLRGGQRNIRIFRFLQEALRWIESGD